MRIQVIILVVDACHITSNITTSINTHDKPIDCSLAVVGMSGNRPVRLSVAETIGTNGESAGTHL